MQEAHEREQHANREAHAAEIAERNQRVIDKFLRFWLRRGLAQTFYEWADFVTAQAHAAE